MTGSTTRATTAAGDNVIVEDVEIIHRVLQSLEYDNARKVESDIVERLHKRFGVRRSLASRDAARAFAAAAKVEDFLGEVLGLLRPYVAMLRDIYRLLERTRSTESGTADMLRLDDRAMRKACRDLPISPALLHQLRETYVGWREVHLVDVDWGALHKLVVWDRQFYGSFDDVPLLQLLTYAPALVARLRQQLAHTTAHERQAIVAEIDHIEAALTELGRKIETIVRCNETAATVPDTAADGAGELPFVDADAPSREYAVDVNGIGESGDDDEYMLSLAQARSGALPIPGTRDMPYAPNDGTVGGLLVLLTVLNGRIERPLPSRRSRDSDKVELLERAVREPAWLRRLLERLLARLDEIARIVGQERYQALLERVQDVIDLPFWKERARLYEVWVLVRTSQAIETTEKLRAIPRLERDGDTWVLRLPKSKGQHAIFDIELVGAPSQPVALLWFQRSTRHRRQRLRSYEPDVRCTGLPPRHRDLLLVECKDRVDLVRQREGEGFDEVARRYLEASDAELLWLVNYTRFGEPASTIRVNDGRSAQFADSFHPGNTPAEFDQTIAAQMLWRLAPVLSASAGASLAVPSQAPAPSPAMPSQAPSPRRRALPRATSGRLELRWEATPRDLDLHLWCEEWPYLIYYGHKGTLDGEPWAALAFDKTDGFGPEVIDFARLAPVRHTVAVHNFSGERALAGCSAEVTLQLDGKVLVVKVPTQGDGRWWHVLEIDGATGLVTINSQLGATSPWGSR